MVDSSLELRVFGVDLSAEGEDNGELIQLRGKTVVAADDVKNYSI